MTAAAEGRSPGGIDADVFGTWMGVFAESIGRGLSAPTIAAYHAALSRHLTTAEFEAAAQLVLERHRYNVWPRPADFLAVVQPPPAPKLAAGAVWQDVVRLVLAHRPPEYSVRDRENEVERELGEAARVSLQCAGGAARLRRLPEGEHEWIRKEFCDHYAGLAEEAAQRTVVAQLTGQSHRPLLGAVSVPGDG